jgi:hypothetical protein
MPAATRQEVGRALGQPTVTLECCACGVNFAVPDALYRTKKADQTEFYCPFGHNQYFPKGRSELEIARDEAARLKRNLASREEDLRSERASHAATKGHLTRSKQRAAAGVCPFCHRNFQQVKRHIANKHPDEGHL